ncbi:MAG: hypothetical protein NTZ13_01295 [Candidatus Parcubacteria bacterium]|nr:hypothetical protein [Candidatus Parcubacteria bacterium]
MEGNQKMSGVAFAGGMVCAIIVDTAGILLPFIGAIFIAFMKTTFWLAQYDMRGTAVMTGVNGLLEMLPITPGSTIFMIMSFTKNRKNMKEREQTIS